MQVRRGFLWVGIVRRRPRVAADFARSGNGIEAPYFVTVLAIERGYSAANAVFSAGDAGEDEPVVIAIAAGQAIPVFISPRAVFAHSNLPVFWSNATKLPSSNPE